MTSNTTFVSFAKAYSIFARELKESKVKLYNCTEGGMFIEALSISVFKKFIESEKNKRFWKSINEIFEHKKSDPYVKSKIEFKEQEKFIGRNSVLSMELEKLISTVLKIAERNCTAMMRLSKI